MQELPKIQDLTSGKLMVVSDLHGNEQDYIRVWSLFHKLRELALADTLVFLGDLIHSRTSSDASAFMIRHLIQQKANQPGSQVYALLGNHEMVHIYHIELWKGDHCYTTGFEEEIREDRTTYIDFLRTMPFALRTPGGVLLNHTGPSGILADGLGPKYGIHHPDDLKNWQHSEQLQSLIASLSEPVIDPYSHLHREIGAAFYDAPAGKFLWELLMNKNEHQYPEQYDMLVERFLDFMSQGHPTRQRVMINGHVQVREGLEVVTSGQLRISSGYGAASDAEKQVILFNAEEPVYMAEQLAEHTHYLFEDIPSPSSFS